MPALEPIRAHADRLFRITVCLRPFRAQGPRIEVERLGDKLVVHNYGHGGSGWSLSWGLVRWRSRGPGSPAGMWPGQEVAVIGCGALGLPAATLLQRAGATVTVYAKERFPDVRSARATGTWTPDSRVCANHGRAGRVWRAVGADGAHLVEDVPELSGYGRALGNLQSSKNDVSQAQPNAEPVEFYDQYQLSEAAIPVPPEPGWQQARMPGDTPRASEPTAATPAEHEERFPFASYSSSITDLTPQSWCRSLTRARTRVEGRQRNSGPR